MKNNINYNLEIQEMVCPNKWLADGVQPPNQACKEKTLSLINQLLNEYDLQPTRITPSIEEGIFLRYSKNGRELIVEVYNDLEIAALINENKKILLASDIIDIEKDFKALLKLYYS